MGRSDVGLERLQPADTYDRDPHVDDAEAIQSV